MKVNLTVEMADKEETLAFINFIEQHANIIDWSVLTDTKKMYAEDCFFKNITNTFNRAKKVRNDYINNNNHKYE